MTQRQLAERLGCCHALIGTWERGEGAMPIVTLYNLCKIFELQPWYFLPPVGDGPKATWYDLLATARMPDNPRPPAEAPSLCRKILNWLRGE